MIAMAEVRMSRFMSVEVSGQALHDRSEQQGGEEGQRADEDDHADQQHREVALSVRIVPRPAGVTRLPARAPATASAKRIGA